MHLPSLPFSSRRSRRRTPLVVGAVTAALALGLLGAPAQAANPVTPGHFTGYGFDQCIAPTQEAMDAWLENSPFLAVGIYISGDSRACRTQPNLTPQWVTTQQRKGWKLLPIALGPQASCHPAFPRYKGDEVIDNAPGDNGRYAAARAQGKAEAIKNAADAAALGIAKKSILWYDLEHFDITKKHCRESALAFVSAWTTETKKRGYTTGIYGGASSSLKMLDDARVDRPGAFDLPRNIWIARWDHKANTSAPDYLREDGWRPGRRMKQYIGDHLETHGGVTINIDSNYLDLGKGSRPSTNTRCGVKGRTALAAYPAISATKKTTQTKERVRAVQCLLRERGYTKFKLNGVYGPLTRKAVRQYRAAQGLSPVANVTRATWVRLLSTGKTPVVKVGSSGKAVHRLQQALTAARVRTTPSTGLFDAATRKEVRAYQRAVKLPASGVGNTVTWASLTSGTY